MALLEASGIGKNFGDTKVLKDISLTLEQGEALAEAGSAGEAAIQGDENLAKADYVSKSVQTDCLMEVAAGTADAAVLDLTLANAMIGEGTDYASLKIVDELNAEEYGVAFRKGSDAAAAVDTAFDELKADGTMQALAEKYELALAD